MRVIRFRVAMPTQELNNAERMNSVEVQKNTLNMIYSVKVKK